MALEEEVGRVFESRLPAILGDGFESRAGQLQMARAVARTLESGEVLVAEAETGTGKSLAYLIPLFLHCRRTGQRAVVSTHTRNLQRQLAGKDVATAMAAVGGGVDTAVLMGRSSYTCRRAIRRRIAAGTDDPARTEWLHELLLDDSGDLEAVPRAAEFLDARTRALVCAPSKEATCAGCPHRLSDCTLFSARRRALSAQVVLVNHALLFADEAADGALLGPCQIVVLDEAHHLDSVATTFLTVTLTPAAVRGSARSVYTPDLEESIAYVRSFVESDSDGDPAAVEALWKEFHAATSEADRSVLEVFASVGTAIRRQGGDSSGAETVVYREGSPLLYGTDTAAACARRAAAKMASVAAEIERVARRYPALENGAASAFRALADSASEFAREISFVVGAADEEFVFFATRDGDDVGALHAAPVDVSASLGALIEERYDAAVLTSATLAVDRDFSFVTGRLGLAGSRRAAKACFESPFDFDRHRRVIVVDGIDAPAAPGFARAAGEVVRSVCSAHARRALVLCTSRTQAAEVTRALRSETTLSGRVFSQTESDARADLMAQFCRTPGGVLVGLASFWEGVDLPGDLVELVVIVKLPFLVPTEPVVQSRSARISAAGEDAFEKLFIPDVVLRLRQGMGRLIRTGSDRGAVLLLDRRLVDSSYGGAVMNAITKTYDRCAGADEVRSRLGELFDGGTPVSTRQPLA